MAANAISSAGMLVKWKLGTDAGITIPTGNFSVIHGVTALPAFGDEVPTLQSTPLSAVYNHTYIPALRDSNGALQLTVNDYAEFRSDWAAVMTAYNDTTGNANGYPVWFEYCYPDGSGLDSFYIPAEPQELGFGGAEVDTVLSNSACILPVNDSKFAAPST